MIVNPACNWVIARLPLGVSDAREPISRSAEEGDLALEELCAVRRHLVECAACRRHESSMRQAAEALAVAAICPPLQADATSLWPEIQQRIMARGRARPVTAETASGWPNQAWERLGRLVRNGFSPDGTDRLRGAWYLDGLREVLHAAIITTQRGTRLRFGLIAGSGLAVIVAATWIVLPAMRQQELASRAVIASNERTPAELAGPPRPGAVPDLEHSQPAIHGNDASTDGLLAQAEPTRVVEAPAPPPVEPAAVTKAPSPPTRFNFDLEHGTPMPPDSRDPKPVY